MSGESDVDEEVPDGRQDLENKVLSAEFRWMRRKHRTDPGDGADSVADSSTDDSGIDETQELTPTQTGTRAQDQNCQN